MTIIGNFLSELEELEKKVTPSPWAWCYDGSSDWSVGKASDSQDKQVCSLHRHHASECTDAPFIAHSRNSLPKLIQAMRVLVEQLSLMAEGEGPNWEDYVQISNAALKQVEEIIGG